MNQKNPAFDYSGDFECRLTPAFQLSRYSTLLTEEPRQTRDWQSRARFLVPELQGHCAQYPEYGLVRHFRLRGMSLRLELANVQFTPPKLPPDSTTQDLKSFRFVVRVRADPNAMSEIAETPKIPPPPQECGNGYRGPH
jgi:hypothetical protein